MDAYSQNPWTEAQWTQIQETVRDEAKRQRVAASFLPVDGPLAPEDQNAPLQRLRLRYGASRYTVKPAQQWAQELGIDDANTRRLTTLSVNVALRAAQIAEPNLSAALIAFRRAAALIARAEDTLVFRGQAGASAPLPKALEPVSVSGGVFFPGLFQEALSANSRVVLGFNPHANQLVLAVSQAMGTLESKGQVGPYALVLSTRLFDLAHTPDKSLVLPADRIKPLLDGPLLRSSTLNWYLKSFALSTGVIVSLGANLVDLVVASEIGVSLLQVTAAPSPRFMFRVSERFTLRVKQPEAVVALTPW